MRSLVLVPLVACSNESSMGPPLCEVVAVEEAIAPTEVSSLGFSAMEAVQAAIVGPREVEVRLPDGSSAFRSITFSLDSPTDARIEEWSQVYYPEFDAPGCVPGRSLVFGASFAIQDDAGDFDAAGLAQVWAQAASSNLLWVDGSFDPYVSSTLVDLAVPEMDCDVGDYDFSLSQSVRASYPWALGPSGGISGLGGDGKSAGCNSSVSVLSWGAPAFGAGR